MFPNDDICNVKAAKNAARRIFQKYAFSPSSQQKVNGLGHEQVSGLIKNAYSAINMGILSVIIEYDPSSYDVSSFMSIFGVGQGGRIQLDSLQQLAVKYLCGQEVMGAEKPNPQQKDLQKQPIQQQSLQLNLSIQQQKNEPQQSTDDKTCIQLKDNTKKPALKISQSPAKKNIGLNFLSPKVTHTQNFFSSKQNIISSSNSLNHNSTNGAKILKPLNYSQIINGANEIFNSYKSKQHQGVTLKEAPLVLKNTYELVGKNKFNPTEEDVKIWMKLCDTKRNGVIEWSSYQNFVKRMLERQKIFPNSQN